MPSNVYEAKEFHKLQSEGKVARYMDNEKKLNKDNKGFYLNKSKSNGVMYKDRVSSTDLVYARSSIDGVTKFSKEKDRAKKTEPMYETRKDHQAHLHKGDMARGDKGVYRE